MKRTLSWILTLVLSFCLCACESGALQETETTAPLETVSVHGLFDDTDNGAKAQMNVGKATTVYGQISSIGTSSCAVRIIYPKGSSVTVEMPIEQLAELENGQFVAIYGKVASYNGSSVASKYTITAIEMLDLETMDAYIRTTVTNIHATRALLEYSGNVNAGMFHGIFYDVVEVNLLNDYVHSRADVFMLTDDTALKDYLIGDWVYSQSFAGLQTESCEYKADGTYLWKYKSESYTGKVYDKEQDGPWSVSGGDLDSFRSGDTYVYVLCDDVFLQMGTLHIRINYK